MTTLREIEQAIKKLPPRDYLELSRWLEEYDLEKSAEHSSARVAAMLDDDDGGGSQLTRTLSENSGW